MKKQFISLTLSSLFGLGVAMASPQAQDQPAPSGPSAERAGTHRPDPNRQIHVLTKRLNLSADQQSGILPILTSREHDAQAIRNDTSLSKEDRRAKLQALREDSQNRIRALLSDEQKQQFDQMEQQMRNRSRARGSHNALSGSGN